MCKHVAAVLYGIGARFDQQPELLFRLREVDEKELIAKAGHALRWPTGTGAGKVLGGEDLSEMFGLDMAQGESQNHSAKKQKPVAKKKAPARNSKRPAKR